MTTPNRTKPHYIMPYTALYVLLFLDDGYHPKHLHQDNNHDQTATHRMKMAGWLSQRVPQPPQRLGWTCTTHWILLDPQIKEWALRKETT